MTGNDQEPGSRQLLPGDLAVLQILATGRPAAAAAEHLSIPLHVVATCLQRLREYYGVHSTADAFAQALARGDLHQPAFRGHQDD